MSEKWLTVMLALGLVGSIAAQTPAGKPDEPKKAGDAGPSQAAHPSDLKVEANLVVLATVVRDRKGAIVQGLGKDDFKLMVGTQPAAIRYFDHDTDVPLTLGLLVDVSRSMREYLDDEKKAGKAFLDSALQPAKGAVGASSFRPADKGFVVQFARQVELLQDITDDRVKLAAALRELGSSSPTFHTEDAGDSTDSEGRRVHGGGTSLYDSVFLSGDELMSKLKGRKALVVLTDGVDSGSKESLTDTLEAAQRADVIVYAVYYKGRQQAQPFEGGQRRSGGGGYPGGGGGGYPGGGGGYPGGGGGGYPGGGSGRGNNPNGQGGSGPNGQGGPSRKPSVDGHQVLARLCEATGGEVFEVTKKQSLDEIFATIAEDLRSQYRLGFTPDGVAAKYGYHKIDLELTGERAKDKLDVEVRDGYFAEGK